MEKKEKSLKYRELRQLSAEEQEEKVLQFQEREMGLQLQSDILATERSLEAKKQSLFKEKSRYPLDSQSIINLQIEIEGLEDGLNRLKVLSKELF